MRRDVAGRVGDRRDVALQDYVEVARTSRMIAGTDTLEDAPRLRRCPRHRSRGDLTRSEHRLDLWVRLVGGHGCPEQLRALRGAQAAVDPHVAEILAEQPRSAGELE